jgi:hypothetical protein
MMKTAYYHLLETNGAAKAVLITVDGTRDGYNAKPGYRPEREFSVENGKTEMAALAADGYVMVRSHDIDIATRERNQKLYGGEKR